MNQKRWLRIIPVALIMYTISYIDRTNISLALDPKISTMMKDLFMDDEMKGRLAGIFFIGYVMMQIPGGFLASRWSARKLISLCLILWGIFAVGCGFSESFRQFGWMRFFLGVAESAVFPATLVLLANWFTKSERARANSYWMLCQPLAVAGSAPITGWLLSVDWSSSGTAQNLWSHWSEKPLAGWQAMLIVEGCLPFVWLPIWWFCIRDHPREAKSISAAERDQLEAALKKEADDLEPTQQISWFARLAHPSVFVMVVLYFLHNCAAYGSMTFFTNSLKGQGFSSLQYGLLFAVPYAVTAVLMLINSSHSDKTGERRGHVAVPYLISGTCLILSVVFSSHFWLAYALLCLAIPGPFVAMAPFWAIPGETLPRSVMGVVMGLVNACGNLGGFVGPYIVGWLAKAYHSTAPGFTALGVGMIVCAALAFLLPKAATHIRAASTK